MDEAVNCPTCGSLVPNGSPICEVDGTVVGEAEAKASEADVDATFDAEKHWAKQEAILAPAPTATSEEDAESFG